MSATTAFSTILDNRKRGAVGDFLAQNIESNSKLSFVSAYFTIYAYEKLRNQLDSVEHWRTYIYQIDGSK